MLGRDRMVNQPQPQPPGNDDLKLETIRWHKKLQEIMYLEAGQHMRALNQLMWQIPSFVIAVNGGLWYATTLASQKSLWIIFLLLALFDGTTVITLFRLRTLIGWKISIQSDIEDPSNNPILKKISAEAGFKLTPPKIQKRSGYIVVSCWAVLLLACSIINIFGVFSPDLFTKPISINSYEATIKSNSSGLVIKAKTGELK